MPGAQAKKYLPYGPVEDVFPHLLRSSPLQAPWHAHSHAFPQYACGSGHKSVRANARAASTLPLRTASAVDRSRHWQRLSDISLLSIAGGTATLRPRQSTCCGSLVH